MNDICITPVPQSYAQPTKFQLVFDRIANTIFYCTTVNIPGVTLGETKQPTPFIDLSIPGDKITYDPLKISFLVDARYTSWTEVNTWLTGLGFPERFDQYQNLRADATRPRASMDTTGIRPPYSDASLLIFTNKNNLQMKFNFRDCFPVALSDINLSYQQSAENILIAEATFKFSYFTIQRF